MLIVVLVFAGCAAVCCLGGVLFFWRTGVRDMYSCYNLTAAENYHEAIPPCRALVEKTPDSADAHNELGWDLVLDGEVAEGLAEARKAVDMQPNDIHYDSLAMALALSGKAEEAMKIEKSHVLLNGQPRNDGQRLTLGMVFFANGDKVNARSQWETARQSSDAGAQKLAAELESKYH